MIQPFSRPRSQNPSFFTTQIPKSNLFNPMSQPAEPRPMAPEAEAVTISTQLMIGAVIFLFMVVVFIFFLYLYAKYYMGSSRIRRSRAHFVYRSADRIPAHHRGLDAEVLKSLPITVVSPSGFSGGIECAVCLSELSEGEEARILPKCKHAFHVECIDMWFHSHKTCPLCRAPVTAEAQPPQALAREGISTSGYPPESLSFPTNVLFWGTQDQMAAARQEGTSSSSSSKRPEGMLVIDIPRRAVEDIVSPLPISRSPAVEMKSPMEEKTPKSARLKSFRRLLSRGKMVIGSACSPRGGDIEQGVGVLGEGSSLTPKTPVTTSK